MKTIKKERAAGVVLVLGMLVACGDGLVGSRCAEGFEQAGESCVPIPATSGDTPGAGGSAGDGGTGATAGAAASGGTAGAGGFGGEGAQGNAGSGNGGGCTPPLVGCGAECVDLTSDPNHCGACFNQCPTGICQNSTCVGAVAGHIVVVGMDFQKASTATSTLLGNAVFMAKQDTVRMLTYRQYAHPTAAWTAQANIVKQAALRNRVLNINVAPTADHVPAILDEEGADVLLVHDQPNAPSGFLAGVGAGWADSIATFTAKGGVVVVLASAEGTAEMSDFLDEAALFDVDQTTDVTGQTVTNVGWLDAVGQGVLSPLKSKQASCAFDTPEGPSELLSYVIVTTQNRPVVMHKVVTGP